MQERHQVFLDCTACTLEHMALSHAATRDDEFPQLCNTVGRSWQAVAVWLPDDTAAELGALSTLQQLTRSGRQGLDRWEPASVRYYPATPREALLAASRHPGEVLRYVAAHDGEAPPDPRPRMKRERERLRAAKIRPGGMSEPWGDVREKCPAASTR